MQYPNKVWFGIILGLLLPVVGYALLLTLFEQLDAMELLSSKGFSQHFRQRTLAIVALCINLLPFNYFQRRRELQAMRGVSIVTVIYGLIWLGYFASELL